MILLVLIYKETNYMTKTIQHILGVFLILLLFFQLNIISVKANENPILFWGVGCTYCEELKETVKEEKLEESISIEYKEIYNNKEDLTLFKEKIKECNVPNEQAVIPMVYIDGICTFGVDDSMKILKAKIAGEDLNNLFKETPTGLSKGQKNTIIMLVSVFIMLAGLLFFGLLIQGKKEKKVKIATILALIAITFFSSTTSAHAICPICTVAVGAGLGLSRYLAIDDLITSIWIGGLIVSTILWMIDWLAKKNKKSVLTQIITVVVTYLLVLVPLYWSGIIGHLFNTLWGIDKILLGIILGSVGFFVGAQLHFYLKNKNSDKTYIPFQKVIFPVGILWLLTLIFYFIVY